MSSRFASLVIAFTTLAASVFAQSAPDDPFADAETRYVSPAEARLQHDVSYLADDLREGRGLGTRGIDDAADYIATVFREIGLEKAPGLDTYFQTFPVRGETRIVEPAKLGFKLPDGSTESPERPTFQPLAIGSTGRGENVPLVFAGFGITAKDDAAKLDYDDYTNIDASGKVVILLRRDPSPSDSTAPFGGDAPTSYATFTAKVANAAAHGAKAVLLVNDTASAQPADTLLDYRATPGGGTIPFVMIRRDLADRLLAAASAPSLAELESRINADTKPQSVELKGVTANFDITSERATIDAKNIIGVIEGEGPHADETIVIAAHYDHLGRGGMGSLAPGSREIHNGADDNASGTATVLEIARRFASRSEPLPRRLVFILFSAEESGLIGSAHFVNNPIIPNDKIVTMINLDMVGRYDESRGMVVYGTGTSTGFEPLVEALATTTGVTPKFAKGTSDGFSDSDHSSFYRKDIPVIFFFTGTHAQYHRPADDTPLINAEGMARIADLSELIVLNIARRPVRPDFLKLDAPAPRDPAAMRGNGAYFGSRPAYGENVEGVKLEGVSADSPAEKAGLKGGDVIVKFAGLKVIDVESYMVAMGAKKPGDEVEVVVLRDGKELTLKATLGSRPTSRSQQN